MQNDDPVALAIEKLTIRAEAAEAKNALYEEQLKAAHAAYDARVEQLNFVIQQRDLAKSSSADNRSADNIDRERLIDAKDLITKQDAEIQHLRHPGFFASLFDKKTIYGAVGGFGVCKALGSGSKIPGIQ